MSTLGRPRALPRGVRRHRWARLGLSVMFLGGAATHVVLAVATPEVYEPFADAAVLEVVRTAWRELFVPNARLLGIGLAAYELGLGLLFARGGRAAQLGALGAIAFHVALVAFGWWYLVWSVTMAALLIWFVRRGSENDA